MCANRVDGWGPWIWKEKCCLLLLSRVNSCVWMNGFEQEHSRERESWNNISGIDFKRQTYTNTSPYRQTHEQNYSSPLPHLCSVYLEWEQTSFFPSTGDWHFHKPSNDKYSIFRFRSVTYPLHHGATATDRCHWTVYIFPFLLFIHSLTISHISHPMEKQVRRQQQQHRHHAVDFNATSCERVECVERCSVRKGCLLGFSGTMDLHRIFWLSQFFRTVFLCVLRTHYTRTVW